VRLRILAPRDVWAFYVAPGSPLPEKPVSWVRPEGLTDQQAALVFSVIRHEHERRLPVIPIRLRMAASKAIMAYSDAPW